LLYSKIIQSSAMGGICDKFRQAMEHLLSDAESVNI